MDIGILMANPSQILIDGIRKLKKGAKRDDRKLPDRKV